MVRMMGFDFDKVQDIVGRVDLLFPTILVRVFPFKVIKTQVCMVNSYFLT